MLHLRINAVYKRLGNHKTINKYKVMKQFFPKLVFMVIIVIAGINANAQNSIDLKWGYIIPVNNHLNQSFSNARSFSIALMHPIPRSKFETGIKFSHDRYESKDDLLTENNRISIHHYLLSGRYDVIKRETLNIFTIADAGLNRLCKSETKSGMTSKVDRTGATVGLGIGVEFKISSRFLINSNVQSQYAYTDDINYTDKIKTNYLFNVAANIGMRIQLKKKS